MYVGERFNSITHLVGFALAIAGAASLITLASVQGDSVKVISAAIYGAVLIILYGVSTLYHSFRGRPKAVFQKLDHIAIYLLIAGTYTPYTLVTLPGEWGWWIFGINWSLAAFGIFYELVLSDKARTPALVTYLIMGWLIVVAAKPLVAALPFGGLALLVLGGVLYTGGIVFYLNDEKIKHFHGIWHLFVMGGSIAHFFSIALYVI